MQANDKVGFQDYELVCRDCSAHFVFSSGEQEFFFLKGLTNEPKRCESCRLMQRARRQGKEPLIFEARCEACDAVAPVPFRPTGKKPVLCVRCLHTSKTITVLS